MAKKPKNLYAVLDIEKNATEKEIKAAYRKLAAKYHPDVCKEENGTELFEKLVEAYEVLKDPDTRKEYDDFVRSYEEGSNLSFEEVFQQFHHRETGAHSPLQGESIEMKTSFKVSEVRRQTMSEVIFDRYENCEDCEGHGFKRIMHDLCQECFGKGFELQDKHTPFGDIKKEKACGRCSGRGYEKTTDCETCKGKGKKTIKVKLEFTIPEQVTEGYRYTIRGKGDAGVNGGAHGDLILVFTQDIEDPYTIQNLYDVSIKVDVPYKTAVLGGHVKVEVPRGEVVKVPVRMGEHSGHQVILQQEGLLKNKNGLFGDLYVTLNIQTPQVKNIEHAKKILSYLS